jgi:hypothetical protein
MPEARADSALNGLTRNQKTLIIAAAFVVVALSLIVASLVMWQALDNTHLNGKDQAVIAALSDAGATSLERAILRVHAIDAAINIKLVANKQAIILVAFAGAFALAAVGFALFLIGADGAFSLEQGAGSGRLLLTGTAPGLLCFFLATALIWTGITHPAQINIGGVNFAPPSPAAPRACGGAGGQDCLDNGVYEELAPVFTQKAKP